MSKDDSDISIKIPSTKRVVWIHFPDEYEIREGASKVELSQDKVDKANEICKNFKESELK